MSYKTEFSTYFTSEVKRLKKRHRSFIDDLEGLKKDLQDNPFQGTELSPGIRKIRMAITSKGGGKAGGARVITHADVMLEMKEGTICFLALYDKGDQETISEKRIKNLLAEAEIK